MTYTFDTQHFVSPQTEKYLSPQLIEKLQDLFANAHIDSEEQYNQLLKQIIITFKKYPISGISSPLHDTELSAIQKHAPLTEPVVWGGVSLKKIDVEKDFIQKLLVINQYGILGFEIHKKKYEKLEVLEGIVLMLYSNHKGTDFKEGTVSVTISSPHDKADLPPYDEHGMIALTNCVVEETSTNHLDDLIYIFNSSQMI